MLNAILNTGQTALANFQVAISVHSNNMANASTEGYVRRTVDFAADTTSGGASIQAIVRNLDAFLERRYVQQSSASSYYDTIDSTLSQVESLFNSTDASGVSTALDDFLAALEEWSADSGDTALRNQVLSSGDQLSQNLNTMSDSLDDYQETLDAQIASQVDTVNALLKNLASVNGAAAASPAESGLRDQRDSLVRELAGYVDVNVLEDSDGAIRVLTQEGQTLVDGSNAYSFQVDAPKATAQLTAGSSFDGQVYFAGTSANELSIQFVSGGDCSGGAGAATFKVSLDGGKTWVKDADGKDAVYAAGDADHAATVDGVEIWFGQATDPQTAPATSLSAGDRFTVMAKTGVSWVTATGGTVNVTPLAGNDSANRLSGGSLAGLLAVRDQYVGAYQDSLDAFAESLIWQMNRAHSQGAGLTPMTDVLGDYGVDNTSVALGESSLHWADQLDAGNLSFALYDSTTGENLAVTALDFSSVTPGQASFDPAVHSLEDVRDAVNATYSGQLTASIQNGQLKLTAADGVSFQVAEDSAGLMAGLGINTLFSGTDAGSIAVNQVLTNDPSRLCGGHVNGGGEVNTGDNTTALAMTALSGTAATFSTRGKTTSATMQDYLNGLCAKVGQDASSVSTSATYAATLAEDLYTQRESVSGVSIDEEMTRILQYQQGYSAAAKLIQTASEMFETILGLK